VNATLRAGMPRAAVDPNATIPHHTISGTKLLKRLKILPLLTSAVGSNVLTMIFVSMGAQMQPNVITISPTVTILTWLKFMMRKPKLRLWFPPWIDVNIHLA
jgi:hypothetical protein